ncbi:hypothetical protein QYE76_039786 [Lolium multiflorum]|uniref:RNase H type-1 domain-containing protein n=1 Tax=Lolium multiflorum TaxID=4521 RepID=A0AAD8TC18_LOLMU|nr:hypothetical protein QYE76_039786 [Lolium multiflorum]
MAPTSSPPRENPSFGVPSNRQRQLAPTMGPEASGGRNREGSAMGSYDDSIAVGRVLYAGNFPIVPPDEWIPARSNPVKLSIVPIGGIHIFIGETVDSDGNALVLEKQRCHFVHFLAHTAGDALHEDEADPLQVGAPGNGAAPDQQEAVGDSDTLGQEEAGNPEESILGNLSPNSDDASSIGTEEYNRLTKELEIGEEADGASSMNTEEFNRKLEELGGEEQADAESAQPMQVLATVAPLDQQETEDEDSNSDPGPSNTGSPLTRERPRKEVLSPEEMVEQARMYLVPKSDVLNKPITPDNAADLEALEARRKEMLATAKKFANTAAAMLEERTEAANFVVHFEKKDREVDESLAKVKQLRKEWEERVACAQEEVDRIAREAIPPRKITFATPTEQQPLTTPKDNMKKGAELLKKKDEEIDINYEARTAIKSQVLADFIADWTEAPEGTPVPEPEVWVTHFDGSKQHQGSGAGVTLKSPTGEELQYVLQIHFEATNNMAEYEALLHGPRIAKEIGIKHIICCGDSDLVAQQVAGTWNARNSVMAAYRDEVDEIAKCFLGYEVKYVRRDDNTVADMLSKLGSGRKPIPPGIFLEHLRVPSVKGANPENPDLTVSPAKEVMAIIPAWTQPFLDYLIDRKLPEDEVHATDHQAS